MKEHYGKSKIINIMDYKNAHENIRTTECKFTISGSSITSDSLDDYTVDCANNRLMAKYDFNRLEFPEMIGIKADAFKHYSLTDDTCVIEGHVVYSFKSVNYDDDMNVCSVGYYASVELPEIIVFMEQEED